MELVFISMVIECGRPASVGEYWVCQKVFMLPSKALVHGFSAWAESQTAVQPVCEMEAAEAMTAAGAGAAAMLATATPSKVETPSLEGFPLTEAGTEAAPRLAASGERGLVMVRGKRRRRGRKKKESMVEVEW